MLLDLDLPPSSEDLLIFQDASGAWNVGEEVWHAFVSVRRDHFISVVAGLEDVRQSTRCDSEIKFQELDNAQKSACAQRMLGVLLHFMARRAVRIGVLGFRVRPEQRRRDPRGFVSYNAGFALGLFYALRVNYPQAHGFVLEVFADRHNEVVRHGDPFRKWTLRRMEERMSGIANSQPPTIRWTHPQVHSLESDHRKAGDGYRGHSTLIQLADVVAGSLSRAVGGSPEGLSKPRLIVVKEVVTWFADRLLPWAESRLHLGMSVGAWRFEPAERRFENLPLKRLKAFLGHDPDQLSLLAAEGI